MNKLEKIEYKKDWNKICATFEGFVNLQESLAWFWNTEEEAKEDLIRNVVNRTSNRATN